MERNTKILVGVGAAVGVVSALASPPLLPKAPEAVDPVERTVDQAAFERRPAAKAMITDIANGKFFSMVVDRKTRPEDMEVAARAHCADKQICTVMGWTDASMAARAMPMLDREAAAQVFFYSVNRNTNDEQALWSCRAFPATPKDHCMGSG